MVADGVGNPRKVWLWRVSRLNLASRKPEKALRIKVTELGANPWDIQSVVNFAAIKNGKYKLSFYARGNGNGKKIRAQIQKHEEKIYLPKDYDLTPEWTKYEWEFGAQTNDMQFSLQYLEKGSYEIDELKIEPVGKTKKKQKSKNIKIAKLD